MTQWLDGNKISTLRKNRNMDQTELANKAGIAQSVISRMERNMQVDYKLSVVVMIARVLGVTIEEILLDGVGVEQLEPELRAAINELNDLDAESQIVVAKTLSALIQALKRKSE